MSWGGYSPWFAFVVHPRTRRDLDSWSAAGLLRNLVSDDEEFYARALKAPPFVISSVSLRNTAVSGEILLVPRLPERIMFGDGRKLIASAVDIAARRGARVVGLGGLTASATRGGTTLLDSVPARVALTNGNSLTAAIVRENVLEARAYLGLERPVVGVLGSTGSVGVAATRLLADEQLSLVLIGRTFKKARLAALELEGRVAFSGKLADVGRADIVVVLTSGASARLRPEHFRGDRPCVVVDVAAPENIPPHERPLFLQRGARVVQGGWVVIPGIVSSTSASTVLDPDAVPGSAPACLAETYLLAREGIREHSVGDASVDTARRLVRMAERRGVSARPLTLTADQNASTCREA